MPGLYIDTLSCAHGSEWSVSDSPTFSHSCTEHRCICQCNTLQDVYIFCCFSNAPLNSSCSQKQVLSVFIQQPIKQNLSWGKPHLAILHLWMHQLLCWAHFDIALLSNVFVMLSFKTTLTWCSAHHSFSCTWSRWEAHVARSPLAAKLCCAEKAC